VPSWKVSGETCDALLAPLHPSQGMLSLLPPLWCVQGTPPRAQNPPVQLYYGNGNVKHVTLQNFKAAKQNYVVSGLFGLLILL
jgi:hypothetical protein